MARAIFSKPPGLEGRELGDCVNSGEEIVPVFLYTDALVTHDVACGQRGPGAGKGVEDNSFTKR